jgi:serine/threonine protein kinase
MDGLIVDDQLQDEVSDHLERCQSCREWAAHLTGNRLEVTLQELFDPEQVFSTKALSEYQILEEIGRGGVGVVYRAHQPRLNRQVALKMLNRGVFLRGSDVARFRRESSALSSLNHPHIVTIFDSGEQKGIPFIAMELVEGPTLDQRLSKGLPPIASLTLMMSQLADAIHHAHHRGIVHRDLKPQNILIAESIHGVSLDPKQWMAKVSDFGLSQLVDDSFKTKTGQLLGTPAYMAPEIARGQSKLVGQTTDIYGLGTILYQCLTGRPPFVGEQSVSVIKAVCEEEPVPIRVLRPNVPVDLRTICERCLDKNPAKRFVSAWELKLDLERFQQGKPIQSRRVTAIEKGIKWSKRNPWQLAAGMIMAVSILAAIAAASWHQRNIARQRNIAATTMPCLEIRLKKCSRLPIQNRC